MNDQSNIYNDSVTDYFKGLRTTYDILNGFQLLLRDFRITDKVDILGGDYKEGFEMKITFLKDEPEPHKESKEIIYNKFAGKREYLVITEINSKYKDGVPVFDKGTRQYRFDVLVINWMLYKKLYDIIHFYTTNQFKDPHSVASQDLETVLKAKYRIIYCVELDGKHSDKKDALRDKFFLDTYGVATARYEVSEMTNSFYKKYRGKVVNKKHMNNFTKTPDPIAYLQNLTMEDIEGDIRANYKHKSKT